MTIDQTAMHVTEWLMLAGFAAVFVLLYISETEENRNAG